MEIDKVKIIELLAILPEDWNDALAHATVLLASLMDSVERERPDKPIRCSANVSADILKRIYSVTIEEQTSDGDIIKAVQP